MKKNFISSLSAAAIVASLSAPTLVSAQGTSLIEEITVTAAKREQSIYEVPIAVSAFQGEKLAEQGIRINSVHYDEASAGADSSSQAGRAEAGRVVRGGEIEIGVVGHLDA